MKMRKIKLHFVHSLTKRQKEILCDMKQELRTLHDETACSGLRDRINNYATEYSKDT